MLQHELDIGCGYSVQIFDNAADLAYAADCCQTSAFVVGDFTHGMHASLILNAYSVRTHLFGYGPTPLTQ